MITTREVIVEYKVTIRIDTDQLQDDITGGLIAGEEDEEIVRMAIEYYVENEVDMRCMYDGIDVKDYKVNSWHQ